MMILGARAEAEQLLKNDAFTRASSLSENDPDDPFRDGTARDDWITWYALNHELYDYDH